MGGKTTSTEHFMRWKLPLGISKNKLMDRKKRCLKNYEAINCQVNITTV